MTSPSALPAPVRQIGAAIRTLVVMTVILGLAYPLLITGIGQLLFRDRANGSVIEVDGEPVGSSLLAQPFADADGTALPEYFQPRPSAYEYSPLSSGASNQGPSNAELIAAIEERVAAVAELEGVPEDEVPVDAVTASGSALDPHISPEYAELQVPRIATERGLGEDEVRDLVDEHTDGRTLGFLGDPRVNVLELNIALDEA